MDGEQPRPKRTAVLVVHGMGSQRPLETVRGVIRAAWFDGPEEEKGNKRIWSHPEPSAVDIDLTVMTANVVPPDGRRSIDFHELYWAHLMSETRTVAVLLWLFELGKRGPRMKEQMTPLWWGTAIFLNLVLLSATFLFVQSVVWLAGVDGERQALVILPFLMALAVALPSWWLAQKSKADKILPYAKSVTFGAAVALGLFWALYFGHTGIAWLAALVTVAAVPAIALLMCFFLMKWWGLRAFAWAYGLSLIVHAAQLIVTHGPPKENTLGWAAVLPWNLDATWSAAAACGILATYVIINAAFLQPYLGDAARYFRNSPANVAVRREIRKQAVDTLAKLNEMGLYDRIIVFAHSLGTVVAYDMLRAYYARICRDFPNPHLFGDDFTKLDRQEPDAITMRSIGRQVIARMADAAEKNREVGKPTRVWFVSDFVTCGSPLTHAYYLMCESGRETDPASGTNVQGKEGRAAQADLEKDFERRVHEREFPVCPPARPDGDGWLTFDDPSGPGRRRFHHGGQFALTRWTNLYFPLKQLFWGDAIGGKLEPVFGKGVEDVAVWTQSENDDDFFAHTTYWNVDTPLKWGAPHIVRLREALKLDEPHPKPPTVA